MIESLLLIEYCRHYFFVIIKNKRETEESLGKSSYPAPEFMCSNLRESSACVKKTEESLD